MDPWMMGVEKALSTVIQGVESSNGALIQMGVDRLQTRSGMSPPLAEAFPNAFAEATQEGVAKLWRRKMDQCAAAYAASDIQDVAGSQLSEASAALLEDLPWMLCIVAKQDEWGMICVEEATRLMAFSAARCEPMVAACKQVDLTDCVQAASSFFTALATLDRLSRLGEVDGEARRAVGEMLMAYGADERSAGSLWGKCPQLSTIVGLGRNGDLPTRWPASAGVHPATIAAALASISAPGPSEEQEQGRPPRRAPRG